MKTKKPHLSVIIPAYNEESRIVSTLEAMDRYLADRDYDSEIIVVDDGSTDGTLDAARAYKTSGPEFKVLENPGNRGKGYSVRHGMLEGRGEYLIFSDADLSTPIQECEKMLEAFRRGVHVAVASRRLGHSRIETKQPWYRELMGRGFNLIVQALAVRGISDTQCGFKGFSREAARAIFGRVRIDRFGFDVEILYLARKLGFRTAEVPVRWIDSPDSRVNPLRDPYRMFLEVLRVRKNDMDGLYRSFDGNTRAYRADKGR